MEKAQENMPNNALSEITEKTLTILLGIERNVIYCVHRAVKMVQFKLEITTLIHYFPIKADDLASAIGLGGLLVHGEANKGTITISNCHKFRRVHLF